MLFSMILLNNPSTVASYYLVLYLASTVAISDGDYFSFTARVGLLGLSKVKIKDKYIHTPGCCFVTHIDGHNADIILSARYDAAVIFHYATDCNQDCAVLLFVESMNIEQAINNNDNGRV